MKNRETISIVFFLQTTDFWDNQVELQLDQQQGVEVPSHSEMVINAFFLVATQKYGESENSSCGRGIHFVSFCCTLPSVTLY
jgi:hypothetical protein